MSVSQKENPFLSALKRLKESFFATSHEADQLVRDAESVCNPRSYDQKLEKKLNLFQDEESKISLEQAKEAIENFSLTLHKTESPDYSKQDPKQPTHLPSEPEQVPTVTNNSIHTTAGDTFTESEVDCNNESIYETNPPDTSSPGTTEQEAIHTHSNMGTSLTNKSITDTSPVVSYTEDTPGIDLTDELEKLREQFAEERENINKAKLAFQHNIHSVAAVKIQTYWRGYHTHRLYSPRVKRMLEIKIQCIVVLQSFYRRHVAIRNFKHLLTERKNKAIILIQNWWRVCIAKRIYRELILAKESTNRAAAVLIQSVWRMYHCRSAYLKIVSENRRSISAAVCIQSLWRGYVDRKVYTLLLLEACKGEDERIALVNSNHLTSQQIAEATNATDMDSQPTKECDNISLILSNPIESVVLGFEASFDENTHSISCTDSTGMHTSCVGDIPVQADKTNLSQQQSQTDIDLNTESTVDTNLPTALYYIAPDSSEENSDPQRIYSLLEERRQSWLRTHRLWQDSYYTPVSSSKKALSDPIPPAGYTPLSTSQLSAHSPSTPLQQLTEVSVAGLKHPVDLSSLDRVPNLLALSLSNCPSVSLEGLQHVSSLISLSLQHCGVSRVDLKGLDNVRFIDFSNNKVSTFAGVWGYPRLLECTFNCNRLVNLGEISRCLNLQKLSVDRNLLVRGEGLDKLISLQELSCTQNHLSELPQISFCSLLRSADLSWNNLKSFCVLSNPLLTELRLDDNNISNLDVLSEAYLPSLQILSLNGNSISSLHSLCTLVLLERLEMKLNYIDNLTVLLECLQDNYRLCVLELDGNPVTQETRYRESLERALPSLQKLDSWELELPSEMGNSLPQSTENQFIKMLDRQLEERLLSQSKHSEKVKELESCVSKNPYSIDALLNARIEQYRESHRLAVHHLREHEYYGADNAVKLMENATECHFTSSIITLQSHIRAHIASRSYRILVAEARAAAIIQKQWRGYRARKMSDIQLRSVVRIQASFRGWWVRSRLSEALRSLQDMDGSDGEDVEELCVDSWGENALSESRIELPQTPMGLYDEIMERYLAQDTRTTALDSDRTLATGAVSLPNIQLAPLRSSCKASTDRGLPLAWGSRTSSNVTVASNQTEYSSATETESHFSIEKALPLEQKVKQLDSTNDPWFLNNEQSIALFNKRAKKFNQGKKRKEERTKLQDPYKRLEKLQTGYESSLHSPAKRVTNISSRLSSCSVSSHNSSVDLVFKWSNTNQKGNSEKNPLKPDKETKRSFLPKIPSRVRAGYSPQLLNDFDSP